MEPPSPPFLYDITNNLHSISFNLTTTPTTASKPNTPSTGVFVKCNLYLMLLVFPVRRYRRRNTRSGQVVTVVVTVRDRGNGGIYKQDSTLITRRRHDLQIPVIYRDFLWIRSL